VVDIQERKNGVSFPVQVLPRSSKCALAGIQEGAIRLKLTAPPVEGRANEECLEFLAELLGIKKGQMDIIRGHKSRKKLVQIDGLTREQLVARLSLLLQAELPDEDAVPKNTPVKKQK
jgi:uncharacterized protein